MESNLARAVEIHKSKNYSKTCEISFIVTVGVTLFCSNKSFFRAGNIYAFMYP